MLKRFKHWFTNVFWYHYKLHTVGAAFLLIMVAVTVHSMATKEKQDLIFVIVSEEPVFAGQGEVLSAFFIETVPGVSNLFGSVLYLGGQNNDAQLANIQLFMLSLVSKEHSLFFIGESMIPSFEENLGAFATAAEMGIEDRFKSIAGPEYIPLSDVKLTEELGFAFEPMYALVKRGIAVGDERYELSVSCLKAFLGA